MDRKKNKKRWSSLEAQVAKSDKNQNKESSSPKSTNSETTSWLNMEVFAKLAIVFLIVQCVGLVVGVAYINAGYTEPLFSEDVNDPINAIGLFVSIMLMTGLLLLILKFKKERRFLWLIETLAVFFTATIILDVFISDSILVMLIAALLIVFRNINRENILVRDIAGATAIIGAGALLGISIGIFPLLAFIIALAIYDLIAVFKTKHMVTLGKAVTKENFAFTIAIPTKSHKFELGNGDLVIPLLVAISIIANGTFNNNYLIASLCLAGSFAGLCYSIYSVSEKKVPLPALPPQTLLMVLIIVLATLFGL